MGQGLLSKRCLLAAFGVLVGVTPGCTHSLFSGVPLPDRSRPVARIETRGGVELGATTEEGVLFLGRTAVEGPCRVHYFLGLTPMVEDGEIRHLGGIYYVADMDLRHQSVAVLERDPTRDDELIALVPFGVNSAEYEVRLAEAEGVEGDVLEWPDGTLPAGTPIFARQDDRLLFVGLVSGQVEIEEKVSDQDREQQEGEERRVTHRYLTYAGPDRLREVLATPQVHPEALEVKHRPDDISLRVPQRSTPEPTNR